jgi:serine protease
MSTISTAPSLPRHAIVLPDRLGFHPAVRAARTAGSSTTTALSYQGGVGGVGVTTGKPQVYLVFWGTQWGTETTTNNIASFSGDPMGMAPRLQQLYQGLGTNGETWSGVVTQYCQGVATGATSCPAANAQHIPYPTGGVLSGVWYDNSAAAPSQSTITQLGTETINAAAHFGNTTAALNRDAQYIIVSPTGTYPDGFNTPSGGWCAWHDYTADLGVSSPYGDIAMTNMPYLTDLGSPSPGYLQGWECGAGYVNGSAGQLDGVTIVAGHEYGETLTDQFPAGGWIVNNSASAANGEEIGDLCAWNGTGGLTGAQNVAFATGTFAMQALWSNDVGACRTSHATVSNGNGQNSITVTAPTAQTVPVNRAITKLQIAATDSGGAAMSFAITSGSLPAGLSLSSSGLISGTPNSPGSSSATVTVTDTSNASASTTVSYKVTDAISVATPAPQSDRTGVAITPLQIVATDSAPVTMNYAASALPSGLSMNTASGLISGTPTKSGSYSSTVTVTDASGASTSVTVKFVVMNSISITTPITQTVSPGGTVRLQVHATDSGGATMRYALSGFSFSLTIGSSGLISGTAPRTIGTFTGTVMVTDASGASASATVTIAT